MRTPRLVLDEHVLERNISRMAERMQRLGLRLRPHVKTHKSPRIMERQLRAGAQGIAVATLREAAVFIDAGAEDVLVAYPPVGDWRLTELAGFARKARITLACDSPEQVHALGRLGRHHGHVFDYYWEIDCGAGRLGTAPGETTAIVLEELTAVSGARLTGLMTFPGHSYRATDTHALRAIARAEGDALRLTRDLLTARGIDPGISSGGSTPTARFDDGKDSLDEYRCGNYVFLDATQVALGSGDATDCALAIEASVVSRPAPDRIILDAGSKALAAERMGDATPGFGLVRGQPNLVVEALYEEHAICHTDEASSLRLGDRVEVIPNHACTCANLHSTYDVRLTNGERELWPVAARGW